MKHLNSTTFLILVLALAYSSCKVRRKNQETTVKGASIEQLNRNPEWNNLRPKYELLSEVPGLPDRRVIVTLLFSYDDENDEWNQDMVPGISTPAKFDPKSSGETQDYGVQAFNLVRTMLEGAK